MFGHLDAFTALALAWLGIFFGMAVVPIHFILQVRHDREGLGWREPLYSAIAFGAGFGLIVSAGTALEGGSFYLQDGLAVMSVVLPSTLIGGFAGRLLGWLFMRAAGLLSSRY